MEACYVDRWGAVISVLSTLTPQGSLESEDVLMPRPVYRLERKESKCDVISASQPLPHCLSQEASFVLEVT